MTDSVSNTTAAAVDSTAVTEGVEQPHAAVSSDVVNVMIAGEKPCARCAGYAQKLTLMNEHNDALTQAMKQMESDKVVSMKLAHAREQVVFAASATAENASQAVVVGKDLLEIRVQQAELDALHAKSELAQIEENNFCYEPWHTALQDNLDQANCEITELRVRETILEEEIGSLQERLTGPRNTTRSASLLGHKIE